MPVQPQADPATTVEQLGLGRQSASNAAPIDAMQSIARAVVAQTAEVVAAAAIGRGGGCSGSSILWHGSVLLRLGINQAGEVQRQPAPSANQAAGVASGQAQPRRTQAAPMRGWDSKQKRAAAAGGHIRLITLFALIKQRNSNTRPRAVVMQH